MIVGFFGAPVLVLVGLVGGFGRRHATGSVSLAMVAIIVFLFSIATIHFLSKATFSSPCDEATTRSAAKTNAKN